MSNQIVLRNCGKIDPLNISTHIACNGFEALGKALTTMSPEEIIEEVKTSNLKGRGGAGFSSGLKWELARNAAGDQKYLICNADEGEMGTFKDRHILAGDPFTLIEGMAIAGHAIGADKAYIYLRSEYHYLLEKIINAVDQAKGKGFLDHLDIEIQEGAGAYICGEESALMKSIEGLRGEARIKPPFPTDRGLFGCPTIINNVETLMNIPSIIRKGGEWFRQIGTGKSAGTKVFSVSGDVERPGVYELEMGSSLKELVVDLAGASEVKAVQVGGATGRILPGAMLETPLSYETVLGSGGVVVFDRSRSIVEMVAGDISFLAEESCGQCTPCREGTEVMLEIFGRMETLGATANDIDALEDLSSGMMLSSLCGLGQAAPIPVLDSLKYFRDEYEQRVEQAGFVKNIM
ncbi:MAG: NADH-ubiquinone oxidoreductase-F iron-sulfur binding region domain-containing protein [Desulfobacterales bacterium]